MFNNIKHQIETFSFIIVTVECISFYSATAVANWASDCFKILIKITTVRGLVIAVATC